MKKQLLTIIILSILIIPILPTAGYAQTGTGQSDPGKVELTNPLTGTTTASNPNELIGKVIKAVLGIVGSLALLMFIYGGLIWMTSSGNTTKIEQGKSVLVWATVGLVIIFTSYGLVRLVFTGLGAT